MLLNNIPKKKSNYRDLSIIKICLHQTTATAVRKLHPPLPLLTFFLMFLPFSPLPPLSTFTSFTLPPPPVLHPQPQPHFLPTSPLDPPTTRVRSSTKREKILDFQKEKVQCESESATANLPVRYEMPSSNIEIECLQIKIKTVKNLEREKENVLGGSKEASALDVKAKMQKYC